MIKAFEIDSLLKIDQRGKNRNGNTSSDCRTRKKVFNII